MATAQTTERADPKTKRLLPGQAGHLRFGRPERVYKLANPADENFGLQIHLDMGWEKINGGKDGDKERIAGGRVNPDGSVSFNGQVLIWLPKEEKRMAIAFAGNGVPEAKAYTDWAKMMGPEYFANK